MRAIGQIIERRAMNIQSKVVASDVGQQCARPPQGAGRIVVVLQGGEVREAGDTAAVFQAPSNPYTRLLLGAASRGYGNLPALPGVELSA